MGGHNVSTTQDIKPRIVILPVDLGNGRMFEELLTIVLGASTHVAYSGKGATPTHIAVERVAEGAVTTCSRWCVNFQPTILLTAGFRVGSTSGSRLI